MNTVTLTGSVLRVEPRGLDQLWTLTRRLDVPLAHVRGATVDPGADAEPKGLRRPGLRIPGKAAGTFSRDGVRSFWNIGTHGSTVVVELSGERYQRLYLSVDEPRALVDTINAALQD